MFAWDYNTFSIVLVILPTALVLVAWMIYTLTRMKRLEDHASKRLKQCPYCAYVFVNMRRESLARCPCCGSFLEEGLV